MASIGLAVMRMIILTLLHWITFAYDTVKANLYQFSSLPGGIPCRWGRMAYSGIMTVNMVCSGLSPWGAREQLQTTRSLTFTTLATARITILPARRVGRRRCRMARCKRSHRVHPTPAPKYSPRPVWLPGSGELLQDYPTLISAEAQFLCGGKTPQRPDQKPAMPPLKIKARIDNKITTIDADDEACWRDVQWSLAAKLHTGAAEFVIYYGDAEVQLSDRLPPPNQYGHIQVDLYRMERPPGRRHAPRTRSRTPASRCTRAQDVAIQTEGKVVDMEALYFRLKARDGAWLLRLELEELGKTTWEDLTVSQASNILQTLYPTCFAPKTRLCIAVDDTLLRPTDYLTQHIRHRGAQIHILPAPLLGSARQQDAWGPPDDTSSEPEDDASPPPHMYILWKTGDVFYPHRIDLPNYAEMTYLQLEANFLRQHPQVRVWGRPIFVNLSGRVLGLSTRIRPNETPTLLAFPSPEYGSANTPEQTYQEGLAIAKAAAADCHRIAQLKLLLRGEQGLAGRLVRWGHDKARCRRIILDLCARYQMMPMAQQHPAASSSSPTQPRPADREEQPWKTVPPKKTIARPRMALIPADWSVQPRQELCFNEDGVYLTTTQEEAEKWAKQIGRPSGAVALLALKPVAAARAIQPVTFRCMVTDQAGRNQERVFSGSLCQMGTDTVKHKDNVMHITPSTAKADTSVRLTVKVRADTIEDKQWQAVKKIVDKRSWVAYLHDVPYTTIDLWDVKVTAQEWQAALRVKKQDLHGWLTVSRPLTFSMGGPIMDEYKVNWDPEVKTLQAARDRYLKTPGYAGLILGKESIGIRLAVSQYDEAMQFLGKVPGDVYELRGIPLHATDGMLQDILDQMGWSAHLLDHSRRVYKGSATYKVKAAEHPGCEVLRTCFEGELVQIQIAKQHARRAQPQQRAPDQEPTTWAASARRSIGIQRASTPVYSVPTPESEPEENDESDADMDKQEDMDGDQADHTAVPSTASRPWTRRAPESAAKLRRCQSTPAGNDSRLDMVIKQLDQLSQVVAGLAAAQKASQSHVEGPS